MALFEFETQAGITHVLASIRASKISPAQKNELRDIVFLYANGGHDQTVKLSLEQKLASYNIEAVSKAYVAPKAPMYTIGGTRQTPVDFAIVNTVKPSPIPTPVVAPVPAPAPASVVPPVAPYIPPPPVVPPPPPPQPVVVTPPPQPVVVAPPPPVAPVQQPVFVPPSVIAQVPVPATVAAQPPVDFPQAGEQQLKRIREIKSLVNEQVGNPVNLIDIDNEAGREYMGALLDAMKKLNTGTSSVAAMQRLEQAYLTVDAAIKRHKGVAAQSNIKPLAQPQPQPLPVQPAPVIPPVAPYVPPAPVVPPPQPVVVTPPSPVVPPPQPRPVQPPPAPYIAPVINSAPTPVAINRPTPPPAPQIPTPAPRPVPPPLPSTPKPIVPENRFVAPPIEDRSPEPVSEVSGANVWESNKPSASAYADSKLTSLAESKLRAQPPVAPASTAPAAPTDPLFAKEIDDGLDQLLSEWSLFKKSGLFGTGPKGREHPLFKKVAGLQIPLLLAGRFEGATQEIKQSITDYMNGWRYEQGIIYMPGETFERYLRRVIRHILDLQKKPVRS